MQLNEPTLPKPQNEKTSQSIMAEPTFVKYSLGLTFDNAHETNGPQDVDDFEQI